MAGGDHLKTGRIILSCWDHKLVDARMGQHKKSALFHCVNQNLRHIRRLQQTIIH